MTSGAAPTTLAALASEVPVDPDRPTATRWLTEELARPEYAQDESLLMRLIDWFVGLFDGLEGSLVWSTPVAVAVVVVLAAVIAVAWWLTGPVRLRRRRRASSVVVHEDDPRTAAEMRAAADAAAARADWATAVLERFRAVVRELEERVVLDERPGRTAVEAAVAGGERLPGLADPLHAAAALFDGVCYGRLPAGPRDDDTLRRLDEQVRAASPAPAPAVVA
ncbi:DUF4129 domain-containing protein [Isoptericola dokdonensis]|uniref:Protein-glutamine gamma-glutamyltransferase-like C-terminal domain-containing protein n=1 Tax=Isoptericola dokdonensis DS-3 TaxID=1300344 RepID=A0A161IA09_9MICO|nr:DUF4129 domain-containing protein [Isoptericola dokdonensis]ANC32878.1 hypothetical protein I598_3369 [Isoptericola dokdonensis DS-3]